MFEQTFKNIDTILRNDGLESEIAYIEQTSWLLFLKYLDDLERDRATEAALNNKAYVRIIEEKYRWSAWAVPRGADGKVDVNRASTGADLVNFVNVELFPYLQGFKDKSENSDSIEYKIGAIFSEIRNRVQSGYNLREIIDLVAELEFGTQVQKHELSHLYESKIKNMGNAGRNGGEYYTPRPLIRAMLEVVNPQIGETICDPAVGSAGFLCEAFDYLKKNNPELTTEQDQTLQKRTLYGKEKKPLAFAIATMNMILHGIETPNILRTNTLAENLYEVQDKDRFDIILANPPFGGGERAEVQQNFPIRTGETAYLFLQHFIKVMRAGGRGGVVIKNTFLTNTDNASVALRKKLLEECNLHTILDCPKGTFLGTGTQTVVLFFEKGSSTKDIWYYQLAPGRNLGKRNPLNDSDLSDFVNLQKIRAESPKSWKVQASNIDQGSFDLAVRNPNAEKPPVLKSPEAILTEIAEIDAESARALKGIESLL